MVLRLAARADVFTINMRARAIERLGLGYAALAALNPRIIYCSMVGFGQRGRYRDKPAYDSIIQGASGMASLHERADGTPRYLPMVIADRTVGLIAANAIMMALFARVRTGRGQSIEVPMFEHMSSLVLAEHLYAATFVPPLGPAGDPRLLDPEARPIRTLDGYICVTANTDAQAFALMDAIGRPELKTDPRFATKTERAANSREFFRIRADEIAKRSSAEWLERLEAADLPVMPYHTLESLPEDPHLVDVGLLGTAAHPTQGRIRSIANPTHYSDYTPPPRRPAPEVGEHSREILGEAGYADAEIDALFAAGVARSFSATG